MPSCREDTKTCRRNSGPYRCSISSMVLKALSSWWYPSISVFFALTTWRLSFLALPLRSKTRFWNVTLVVGFLFIGSQTRIRGRSEEHTSELQSLMRISYAVFCLKKKINKHQLDVPYNHIH